MPERRRGRAAAKVEVGNGRCARRWGSGGEDEKPYRECQVPERRWGTAAAKVEVGKRR